MTQIIFNNDRVIVTKNNCKLSNPIEFLEMEYRENGYPYLKHILESVTGKGY